MDAIIRKYIQITNNINKTIPHGFYIILLTTITAAELLQRMLSPHIHLPENDLENKFYIEV